MAPPPESQWPPVDGRRSFQILETAPLLQISDYAPDTKRVRCSYFQVLKSYNEKLLSKPKNNRAIYSNDVVPLSLKYNLLQPSIRYEG